MDCLPNMQQVSSRPETPTMSCISCCCYPLTAKRRLLRFGPRQDTPGALLNDTIAVLGVLEGFFPGVPILIIEGHECASAATSPFPVARRS